MGCTPAPLCKKGLADATAAWPNRNRASDGICGDEAHQNTQSDHNSGNAFDLTHDPGHGCDAHHWAEVTKQQNPYWVKYIISNDRIWNPDISNSWREYTGSNPHTAHVHFSIHSSARNDQPAFPWSGGGVPSEEEELMAAKDDINAHTDARQSAGVVVAYNQLHRFESTPDGKLRHQFFDPASGRWSAETWANNVEPGAPVDVMADYDGKLHVFCPHEDGNSVTHVWFSHREGRLSEAIPR